MELIIFIGLQASGKSTFYRSRYAGNYEHISKDLLKRSKNKNKDQRQSELIERAFMEHRSVVVDNTNITVQDRLPLIELGCRYHATITGYYFQPDVLSSRTRNLEREGKEQVPDKAIFIMAYKLEPPTYAEGFDTLYYLHISQSSTIENPAWEIEKIPRS